MKYIGYIKYYANVLKRVFYMFLHYILYVI